MSNIIGLLFFKPCFGDSFGILYACFIKHCEVQRQWLMQLPAVCEGLFLLSGKGMMFSMAAQ